MLSPVPSHPPSTPPRTPPHSFRFIDIVIARASERLPYNILTLLWIVFTAVSLRANKHVIFIVKSNNSLSFMRASKYELNAFHTKWFVPSNVLRLCKSQNKNRERRTDCIREKWNNLLSAKVTLNPWSRNCH